MNADTKASIAQAVIAQATTDAILAVGLLALAVIGAWYLIRYARTPGRFDGYRGDSAEMWIILSGLALLGLLGTAAGLTHDAVPRLATPEAYAELKLMHAVRCHR